MRLTWHPAAQRRLLRCALVLSEVLLALLIAQPASLSAVSPQSSIRPSSETAQAPQSEVASWAVSPLDHKTATPSPTPTCTPTPKPPEPTPSPTPEPPPARPAPAQTAVVVPETPAPPTAVPPPTLIPAPPPAIPPPPANACGQGLIPLINQVRAENGLLPLVESSLLNADAQQYADFIASRSILSHTADGRTLDMRAEAAGYTGWKALGENLAGGYDTPEQAVTAWLASPGHHDIIMSPSYTETGVGCAWNAASPYGSFWVQEFGVR